MTKWLIQCSVCGNERILDVGFNLTVFRGKIYLYCKRCKTNREHKILGFYSEEGRLVQPTEFTGIDIAD